MLLAVRCFPCDSAPVFSFACLLRRWCTFDREYQTLLGILIPISRATHGSLLLNVTQITIIRMHSVPTKQWPMLQFIILCLHFSPLLVKSSKLGRTKNAQSISPRDTTRCLVYYIFSTYSRLSDMGGWGVSLIEIKWYPCRGWLRRPRRLRRPLD